MLNAFHVHTGDTKYTLEEAIAMMKEVDTFFKKCKQDVKEFYSINTQLQGPQGCVSSVFSDNVQTLLYTLQSLLKDYEEMHQKVISKATFSKIS